jgi:hypothetical protein
MPTMTPVLAMRPITRRAAAGFIGRHHRHNGPVVGWLFGVGLYDDDRNQLVAVGIAGRPSGRVLDDGLTIEITRVCVVDGLDPTLNACSRLCGALCRAAKALGYRQQLHLFEAMRPTEPVQRWRRVL